jgi:hypothetical protein
VTGALVDRLAAPAPEDGSRAAIRRAVRDVAVAKLMEVAGDRAADARCGRATRRATRPGAALARDSGARHRSGGSARDGGSDSDGSSHGRGVRENQRQFRRRRRASDRLVVAGAGEE